MNMKRVLRLTICIRSMYKEYKTPIKGEQLEHFDDVMLDGGPTIWSPNKVATKMM